MDRLAGSLDAVLHLLDRQVVDADDLLVCKVDDVELTVFDDGVLGVTGLLVGPAALVPRYGDDGFGRLLHDFWRRLGTTRADRDDPYRIDLELVEKLGSAVELNVGRDGALVRQGQRGRSLNQLLQMPVQDLGRAPPGSGAGRPPGAGDHRARTTDPGDRPGRGTRSSRLLLRLRPADRPWGRGWSGWSSGGCTGTRRTSTWRISTKWTGPPGWSGSTRRACSRSRPCDRSPSYAGKQATG